MEKRGAKAKENDQMNKREIRDTLTRSQKERLLRFIGNSDTIFIFFAPAHTKRKKERKRSFIFF